MHVFLTFSCKAAMPMWALHACALMNLFAGLPQGTTLSTWREPLWDESHYSSPNFLAFRKARGAHAAALPPPAAQAERPALDVDEGAIPDIDELRALLEQTVVQRFGSEQPPRARTPLTEADADLVTEKGWVYKELEDTVTAGEEGYLKALRAYMCGGSDHGGLKRVIEYLEGVPGNEQGS